MFNVFFAELLGLVSWIGLFLFSKSEASEKTPWNFANLRKV